MKLSNKTWFNLFRIGFYGTIIVAILIPTIAIFVSITGEKVGGIGAFIFCICGIIFPFIVLYLIPQLPNRLEKGEV